MQRPIGKMGAKRELPVAPRLTLPHRVIPLIKTLGQSYHDVPLLHQQLLVPLHLLVE